MRAGVRVNFDMSAAASLKNGRFDRKRIFVVSHEGLTKI